MTLTEVSYKTRKMMPFAILIFLMVLIFFYAIKLFFLYIRVSQPKSVYINPIFDKIKRPVLNASSPSGTLAYTLDTIEGKPVTATATAKIYYLPQNTPGFGYFEKIYVMAKSLGFNTDEIKHKTVNGEAIFEDSKQKLTVDITNFNFTYEYNFTDESELFKNTLTPDQQQSETNAIDFLKSVGRYPEELAKGKTNTIFLSYDALMKQTTLVKDNTSANMVEVDFYRPDIDEKYPIVSPKYFNSQNYILMIFQDTGSKILRAQVQFFEKLDEKVGIYPLITGDQAYSRLQAGSFYLINPSSQGNNIILKTMFLGYFDPDTYQEYLQPVYVFLGEGDFVGYVPAVKPDYLIE